MAIQSARVLEGIPDNPCRRRQLQNPSSYDGKPQGYFDRRKVLEMVSRNCCVETATRSLELVGPGKTFPPFALCTSRLFTDLKLSYESATSPRRDDAGPVELSAFRVHSWVHMSSRLPRWVISNSQSVWRETEQSRRQAPSERWGDLVQACETLRFYWFLPGYPERVKQAVDPMPESSRAAFARLREEYRRSQR